MIAENNRTTCNRCWFSLQTPAYAASAHDTYGMNNDIQEHVEVEESLNIMDKEKELIIKALKKHKRKEKRCSAGSWYQ